MPITRHYRLYNPETDHILISTAPRFIEQKRLCIDWSKISGPSSGTVGTLAIMNISVDDEIPHQGKVDTQHVVTRQDPLGSDVEDIPQAL